MALSGALLQVMGDNGDNSHLCSSCAGITIQGLEVGLALKPSLQALEESAEDCTLCLLFLRSLVAEVPETRATPNASDIRVSFDYCNRPWMASHHSKQYSELVRIEARGLKRHLRTYIHAENATQRNELTSIIKGRPVKVNNGGFRNLGLVREWVLSCARNHSSCSERGAVWKDKPLPTRVIDIVDMSEKHIRLNTTKGQSGRWVALSHRWNSQSMPKLTVVNLEQMHISVDFDAMPQTFQDTIVLAHFLEIRYVWIDAFCIIQDSVTDWDMESAAMPAIYANSYLTVAVAASEDLTVGFLRHTCPEHVLKGCNLQLSSTEELWFAPPIDSRVPEARRTVPFPRSILDTRGWCLQERILSPRLLAFLPREMTWTCEMHIRESSASIDTNTSMYAMLLLQSTTLHHRLDRGYFDRAAKTMVFWSWYREILEDYTSRSLTYKSDKLTAIGGVAKMIHEATSDVYWAGLWRDSLPRALLWQAPHEISGARDDVQRPRPVRESCSEFRAPSWSWASLDGRITFKDATPGVAVRHAKDESDPTIALLINGDTRLRRRNPFGELRGGFLEVRGPLRPFLCGDTVPFRDGNGLDWNWEYEVPELVCLPPENGTLDPSCRIQTGGVCLFDTDEPPTGSLIWCLRITAVKGLILTPTENTDEFRRVGIFSLRKMRHHLSGGPQEMAKLQQEFKKHCNSLFENCVRTIVIV